MQKAQEIMKKYLEGDKLENLVNELKENNIYFSSEENLDIRYSKLKNDVEEKSKLYEEAQKYIENLSQGVKSSEELKAKQAEYEQKIKDLEAENQEIKINSSLKQALLQEKAKDIEYLTYKIKNEYQNSKTPFEFSADGNLKGLDEIIETVKKQHINLFEPQEISTETPIIGIQSRKFGESESNVAVTGLTDIYAAKFDGYDGFLGVTVAGDKVIDSFLPDFSEPGAVKTGEVEMIGAVALKNSRNAGVLRNIKII